MGIRVTVVALEDGLFQVFVEGRPVLEPMAENAARHQAEFFKQVTDGKFNAVDSDHYNTPKSNF